MFTIRSEIQISRRLRQNELTEKRKRGRYSDSQTIEPNLFVQRRVLGATNRIDISQIVGRKKQKQSAVVCSIHCQVVLEIGELSGLVSHASLILDLVAGEDAVRLSLCRVAGVRFT